MMLNVERRQQFLTLMDESGWDTLLLYGNTARKDFFRSLVNFNFFGPHAVAALTSNGISIVVSHPWDNELLQDSIDAKVSWDADFNAVIHRLISGKTAIAGREFMETRFVDEATVSATAPIENLRRFKTREEIEYIRQAARIADAGYRHFVETAEAGMAEYELVAEVEAFLKTNGAEDNLFYADRLRRNGSLRDAPSYRAPLSKRRHHHYRAHATGERLLCPDLQDHGAWRAVLRPAPRLRRFF